MKNKVHNNIKFWIESFTIKSEYEIKTKYQAFYGDGYALCGMCDSEAIATMFAIKAINENF